MTIYSQTCHVLLKKSNGRSPTNFILEFLGFSRSINHLIKFQTLTVSSDINQKLKCLKK